VIDSIPLVPVKILHGVPQGSVIGPKLYTMYVNALRKVADEHGIKIHQYSDDTTIYVAFKFPPAIPDQMDALRLLSLCAGDLIDWFAVSWVKLNPDKSDFLYFVPADLASKLPRFPLRVGERTLDPSVFSKVLGVVLSEDLSMDRQISAVVKASNFHLYRIGKIRGFLSTAAAKTLVHSLVISHLDYANSLLAGLPMTKLKPLQSIQNSAARLIFQERSLSTDEAKFRLHWLPVQQRVNFKVLLFVFDCLQGSAPEYLQKTIRIHVPRRAGIRSSSRSLEVDIRGYSVGKRRVSVPVKSMYLNRSFSGYAPYVWNSLPAPIRTTTDRGEFKRLLKTHLFNLSFPQFTNR
jgi:hypothetical protein